MTLMWVLFITLNFFTIWGLLNWHLQAFALHIQDFEGNGQPNKIEKNLYD